MIPKEHFSRTSAQVLRPRGERNVKIQSYSIILP